MIKSQGYDPVKISIKNLAGPEWFVACMIPKGNHMVSVLRKEDSGDDYKLVNFKCSNRTDTPTENKDLEDDFRAFLEKGLCRISRSGKIIAKHELINE